MALRFYRNSILINPTLQQRILNNIIPLHQPLKLLKLTSKVIPLVLILTEVNILPVVAHFHIKRAPLILNQLIKDLRGHGGTGDAVLSVLTVKNIVDDTPRTHNPSLHQKRG